jgi:condensin complex subunit 1
MKIEDIKKMAFTVICLAVKHHGQAVAVQITIMQSLQFYEHLSDPLADCLIILTKEYDYPQLGDEILREIAGKTFGSQDQKGPRTFARFLTKYAEACPRSVMKQLSLLQDQLDSEVSFTPFKIELCYNGFPYSHILCDKLLSKFLGF